MNRKKGFTLLEVLAVVIIIGILAALGWSSMNELIQTNKAKEAARSLASFAERAVAEGKMRKDSVKISISAGAMEARLANPQNAPNNGILFSQPLPNGFSANAVSRPDQCNTLYNADGVTSKIRIGISGVSGAGCFVVCNASGYCGSTVKTETVNAFTAQIKRKNSDTWEGI